MSFKRYRQYSLCPSGATALAWQLYARCQAGNGATMKSGWSWVLMLGRMIASSRRLHEMKTLMNSDSSLWIWNKCAHPISINRLPWLTSQLPLLYASTLEWPNPSDSVHNDHECLNCFQLPKYLIWVNCFFWSLLGTWNLMYLSFYLTSRSDSFANGLLLR